MLSEIVKSFELIFSFNGEIYGIIAITLLVTIISTLISALLGVFIGLQLSTKNFIFKKTILKIVNTCMGLPPVLVGLVVTLLISNSGPFGFLGMLFTIPAMILAQIFLITPIIAGISHQNFNQKFSKIKETCMGININKKQMTKLLLHECKTSIAYVTLIGYGRAISEVGAVSMVGGNIRYNTRILTTAIMLETGKGAYSVALALGMILLLIAFIVNHFSHKLLENK